MLEVNLVFVINLPKIIVASFIDIIPEGNHQSELTFQ